MPSWEVKPTKEKRVPAQQRPTIPSTTSCSLLTALEKHPVLKNSYTCPSMKQTFYKHPIPVHTGWKMLFPEWAGCLGQGAVELWHPQWSPSCTGLPLG